MSLEDEQFPESFGPFVLLQLLGSGGMGAAYLALHPESDQLLVVKRMHPELLQDDSIFKRFVHEAEVAAHVRHPNVASLVAMGRIEREPFLATEFVFGVQLSSLVDRVETSQIEQVPLPIALYLGVELASGLEAIHESVHLETGEPLGLIHRDIGARNVLAGFDGRVRIIDLGLGKSVLSDWQTASQMLAGSPDYMPPEQAMGSRVDARADVYAAAVTVWELLVGHKRIREEGVAARLSRAIASQPEDLVAFRPDASPKLERVLKNAMATDPAGRTPTAHIFYKGLRDELHAQSKTTQEDIVTWIDAACATVIAKERRRLEEAKEGAKRVLNREQVKTELFVGRPDLEPSPYRFYTAEEREPRPPPTHTPEESESSASSSATWKASLDRVVAGDTVTEIASLIDPANLKKAPVRVQLMVGIGAFMVLVLIAVGTALLLTDSPPAPAIVVPERPVAPPIIVPDSPETVVVEVEQDPKPETGPDLDLIQPPPLAKRVEKEPPSPVPADIAVRKRALLNRLRRLRKVSFEIKWQKKLTRLSSKLSRARSLRTLQEIETALLRMEQRSGA